MFSTCPSVCLFCFKLKSSEMRNDSPAVTTPVLSFRLVFVNVKSWTGDDVKSFIV